ncbi:MAG: terpene cyclase/mutase family protein [Verrucomicrobia bacterium]|nr:terpene cyclase/mutase family protein [Verrucomicrobiota bacterium]
MTTPTQSLFNPQTLSHVFMTRFRSLPFYLVAVLLHVLFLLIFGTYAVSEKGASVITQFTAPDQKVAPGPPPPPPPPPPEQKKTTPVQTAQAKSMAPRPTMIATPLPSAAVVIPVPAPVPQMDMGKSLASLPKNFQVSGMYAARISNQSRAGAITRYGGGATKADQLEGAVYRALNWLQKNQNEDGSWGGGYRPAMTGLALLTMLAHGETQTSKQYGETVQKGVQWLMDFGRKNKNVFNGNPVGYQHAIATYALAEDYALTQIGDLLTVLEGAVEKIVTSQTPGGCWNYSYDKPQSDERPFGGDLSIAGWNIQALKAAKNAGVHVKGLDECMRKALDFCKAVYDDKTHRFGYGKKGGGSDGLLGVGILSMMFLGAGDSKEARGALRVATNIKCDWNKSNEGSSYVWYYVTQAMFQGGGSYWVAWNREFRDTLLKRQMADGHWPVPGGTEDVPPADAKWKQVANPKDSPIYHTTMLCMMLEVYYRFLPTFK